MENAHISSRKFILNGENEDDKSALYMYRLFFLLGWQVMNVFFHLNYKNSIIIQKILTINTFVVVVVCLWTKEITHQSLIFFVVFNFFCSINQEVFIFINSSWMDLSIYFKWRKWRSKKKFLAQILVYFSDMSVVLEKFSTVIPNPYRLIVFSKNRCNSKFTTLYKSFSTAHTTSLRFS